jgi:hypothetical protein
MNLNQLTLLCLRILLVHGWDLLSTLRWVGFWLPTHLPTYLPIFLLLFSHQVKRRFHSGKRTNKPDTSTTTMVKYARTFSIYFFVLKTLTLPVYIVKHNRDSPRYTESSISAFPTRSTYNKPPPPPFEKPLAPEVGVSSSH